MTTAMQHLPLAVVKTTSQNRNPLEAKYIKLNENNILDFQECVHKQY